ncbi:ankyrin repeat domain-containing protein [Rickettsia endosymbiont of Gonocerus acuteangulatus]|uniref:ankyrin repeat domain-containing protein n=1 Tax=Rickettsia endosymbiont of Gonocerus acuteangulatus TaxID=3066266 RepID=UPI003132DF2A
MTRPELASSETLQKINEYKASYSTSKKSSSSTTDQTSNYLDNILNSTSPITSEILFKVVNRCKENEQYKLKLILEKAFKQGINIDIQEELCGYTLLHTSITENLDEVATFLLEEGANPNIQDYYLSDTPLHYVVKTGVYTKYKIEIVELLIKFTNLELKNIGGLTTIQDAVISDNKEVTKLLIQYGANIDVKLVNKESMYNEKNLIELAESRCEPILRALLTLTKACKDNDFSIVDNTISSPDVTPSFINEAEHQEYNLAGETDKFAPETA